MKQYIFKPCPFCGSEYIGVKSVVLDRIMGKDSPCSVFRKVWAYCRTCGCEGRKRTGDLVYEARSSLWQSKVGMKGVNHVKSI